MSLRVAVVNTQVPFVSGGAELHAQSLITALERAGHEAVLVSIPFKWYPPERILDHMLACRLLDLSESNGVKIDVAIGLKFPAYLVPHPRKVIWLLHQHRTAYDQWDAPFADLIHHPAGLQIRDAIRSADREHFAEATRVFANSRNVASRLSRYCEIDSTPLYHPPPGADLIRGGPFGDYLFFPSRLTPIKRQELVLEGLAHTREPVRVRFAGSPDVPSYLEKLKEKARALGVSDRVEWLGPISEEEKRAQYAGALGVLYPPLDEDYGYVTLEAMLAGKPVVTCADSGGPLEFIQDREQGRVVPSSPEGLGSAMDELWSTRGLARSWGEAARARYEAMDIRWPSVVEKLLG